VVSQGSFFPSQSAFRTWLKKNHERKSAIFVGFYKKHTGKPSMSWSESVDVALCFGWIDGIRRTIDSDRYCIRFTPRKPTSTWSAVNIRKAKALIRQGMMTPSGLLAYKKRVHASAKRYSYENKPRQLPRDFVAEMRRKRAAWEFVSRQSVSYRRTVNFWILSARKKETQRQRLKRLVAASAIGKRVY